MASSFSPLLFTGCPGPRFHDDECLWSVFEERDVHKVNHYMQNSKNSILPGFEHRLFKPKCKDTMCACLQIRAEHKVCSWLSVCDALVWLSGGQSPRHTNKAEAACTANLDIKRFHLCMGFLSWRFATHEKNIK